MAVWRLQVNTGGTNVADYCLKNHVAAMGWSLRELTQAERSGIHTFLDYCNLARTQYKSFDSVCRMVEDVKEGDLLWMRSRNEGKYYIARVKANSTWVFREDAVQMDAANQLTNIDWYPATDKADEESVPGAVATSFIMGSTIQRIKKNGVEKPIATVKSKKYLTDFTGMKPVEQRNSDEAYLSDDVSFVIAHNKKANDTVEIFSLLSYTNVNVLPFTEDIPLEVIAFLDPTIEKLCFEQTEGKTFIHLKFKDEEEIILNNAADLEQYLSSGTIKGIITFSMVKEVLHSGGYLLVDEIENHFNKEIVTTLVRFFMDSRLNKNGGTLIFTTHYPELLDEYDRNDGICIVRNRNGITAENLSYILKRNDIKKSDAYQSGFLEGTTPAYEAYMRLKKSLAASIN